MTIGRNEIAAMVLQGMVSDSSEWIRGFALKVRDNEGTEEDKQNDLRKLAAETAVKYADALIKAGTTKELATFGIFIDTY